MKKIVSLLLAFALLALPSCDGEQKPIAAQSFALDTVVSVTLYDGTQEDADAALRLIDELDALLDRNDPSSEVFRLNANDGGILEGDLLDLVGSAGHLCRATGGAFDFAIGRLTELWNFKTATEPPSDEAIADALERSGCGNISDLSQIGTGIELCGTQLDFGGVAKGYIGDKVAELLRERGVRRALVNLGGNVTTVRAADDDKPFRIGIQDPFGAGGETIGCVEIGECSVSTSGVYQRFFEYDGVKYHHILDPRTGRPADSGVVSATIICGDGATADALATACVVLGEEGALELIHGMIDARSSTDETELFAILVREDGTIAFSRGAEEIFTPTK